MSTPHIEAKENEFAKTVIMPGDPKRARYIAENFLENPKLISEVRGIPAFTGKYKGKLVSVMASGMGNPSMGIYSHELFEFYNVKNIIRVGTCGVYNPEFKVGDVAVAVNSVSLSNYRNIFKGEVNVLPASDKLIEIAKNTAKTLNSTARFGNVYCSDAFYGDEKQKDIINNYDCFGVEMETTALFKNAIDSNKDAIAILTVSDNIVTHEQMTPKEREQSLNNMITFALEMAEWEYFY